MPPAIKHYIQRLKANDPPLVTLSLNCALRGIQSPPRAPLELIRDSLLNNATVQRIELEDNNIDARCIEILAPALTHPKNNITTLYLAANPLGCKGMKALSKYVLSHPHNHVSELYLGRTLLDSEAITCLVRGLTHPNNVVQFISLRQSSIDDDVGWGNLFNGLCHPHCQVQRINLSSNQLTSRHAALILALLDKRYDLWIEGLEFCISNFFEQKDYLQVIEKMTKNGVSR